MRAQKLHSQLIVFGALLSVSLVLAAMVIARMLYSGASSYRFLIWNLFLAWLPLIFASIGVRVAAKRASLLAFTALWLLFFPNALYLVTDLIHLRDTPQVPLWYDAIMIFSFALTGLLLGLLSLYLMQSMVTRRFGQVAGWLFAVTMLGISSYGVYVGRFLRWNSWDIIAHPTTLLNDILNSLFHPEMILKTYAVSLLLSAVFTFTYIILCSLPQFAFISQPRRDSRSLS
jgi:uncharacterized membrane protein